jgi:hypothetical protein
VFQFARFEETETIEGCSLVDWTKPEIISALALIVSSLSLSLSFFSLWRTAASETPTCWVELETTTSPDRWLMKVHLRNRSKVTIKGYAVAVPIIVPFSNQHFYLIDYYERLDESGKIRDGATSALKMSFSDRYAKSVDPGELRTFPVVLWRNPKSNASSSNVALTIQIMKRRSTYKIYNMRVEIPGSGIAIKLG